MSKEEAEVYAEGVRRDGAFISAKVEDNMVATADAAIAASPYVDVASRGAAYRAGTAVGMQPYPSRIRRGPAAADDVWSFPA